MSYQIEKRIIPGLKQGKLTASNFVVAHEAGNPRNTGEDSLEREINFMTRNHHNAFTSHFVGGGGRIVQLAEVGKFQYGAGHKANPYSYAHVELARTNDRATFEKDYKAYVWLLRKLAKEAGIPVKLDEGSKVSDKGIKSHVWITRNIGGTTHVDPYGYLESFGISKAQFKKDIENGIGEVQHVSKPVTSKPQAKPSKSISQLADEVIAGKHGNGHDARRKSLGISQAEYDKVRAEVNRRVGVKSTPKPKKSISQMADEVIRGKHGNGHAQRQKSLGISKAEYEKVRAEVNKRL